MKKNNRTKDSTERVEVRQINKILGKYFRDFNKKYNFIASNSNLWKKIENPINIVISLYSYKNKLHFIIYALPLFVKLSDWTHFRIKDLTSKYSVVPVDLRPSLRNINKFDWPLESSNEKNSLTEILDIISKEGIKWIYDIGTIEKMIQFLIKKGYKELNYDDYEVLTYCYLWEGNIEKSKEYLNKAIEKLNSSMEEARADWEHEIKRNLSEFKETLEKNPVDAKKILDRNITRTVIIRNIPHKAWGNLKDLIENNLKEVREELKEKESIINVKLLDNIKSNRTQFEKELNEIKLESDWSKFEDKWFKPYIWPHRRHDEALDELHKRKAFMKTGFKWYPFVSTIEIPRELHFEYKAAIDKKNKLLNVSPIEREATFFAYFNAESPKNESYSLKEGRQCAYCYIYVKSVEPKKCPICGKKLFFKWVMEDK